MGNPADPPPPSDEQILARGRAFADDFATRRSVRRFAARPVGEDVIRQCLRAACHAPSGANRQGWHFTAIRDEQIKARIRAEAEKREADFHDRVITREWSDALSPLSVSSEKPFLTEAPWLIAVFVQQWSTDPDGRRERNFYAVESTAIAAGVLVAAVHHAGLGCLTYTPSRMGFLREMLDRPEGERPMMILAVGHAHPDWQPPELPRRRQEDMCTLL